MEPVIYWNRVCAPYLLARFGHNERGASLVEYSLLVAFIAIACVGAVTLFGSATSGGYIKAGSSLG